MTDFQTIASRYIDAWNETDPALRRDAVEALWAPDGRYVDPLADVQGHDRIGATIAAVHDQFPGFRFRLTGPVDGYGNQCRFSWELGPDGAEAPIAGSDVVVLAQDGKVQAVFGFLDRVPAAA